MKLSIAMLSLALLAGGSTLSAQQQDKKAKAYMVADAHLDTQWNWDIQTTINEYVWNTLNQNLFLLKRYPNYVFNFEGGVKYAWMKEYYPEQYEEMKEFIHNGRWHISGSSWDATDALVPSPESFIRNITLGQQYYRDEFGVESTDIFLPDCFGFGWTLPTIGAHCGLIGFSSQKLDWRHNPFYGKSKHPFTIGLWQGIDGSRIMLAHGYDYGRRWKDEDLSHNKQLKELASRTPLNTVYRYYGTGDTGGSPNIASVRAVEKGLKGDGPLQIISATSDQLFKDYLPYANHPELPVFDGELLMDVHGTGCYTSEAAMKLYNRQNEVLANAAENAAVAAEWLGQAAYPRQTLTEAWRRFIVHQFHDDLTGTSIPRAYEFSWNDELISLQQFAGVLTSSVNAIAGQLDTRVKGTPVILYNAHAFPVSDIAEVVIDMPKAPKGCTVYNEKGQKVAAQVIGYADGKARLLVAAFVPASGYAVYDVRTGGSDAKMARPAEDNTLENSVYKIKLDSKGDIVSLFDKKNNKELVKDGKAIRLALFTENKSYDWPAWEILKETTDREPVSITGDVKIELVENGAIRKVISVEKRHGDSFFKQYITLYEGSRANQIDFYNEIDWQSTNALLKAEFPLTVSNPEATYDLGIGSVKRGNNTLTAYEVYAQYWADLTDRSGNYGVSVLNDSKYGWDKPNDNTLRLTLLHTPETKGGYTYQNRQDFGYHSFTYSLIGHAGELDKPLTVQKAEQLNQPLKAFKAPKHAGRLGKAFSFASSDNDKVIVKTLKKAEASDEYVVRVYETEGKQPQTASLTFAGEIESANEADGTEKTIGQAAFSGNSLQVSIKPYSVKTYKVKLKKVAPAATLQYAYLPLNYDRKCTSFNEFRREGNFESGYSYAAELLPDEMTVNAVPFRFGEKDAANGLTCKGDTLMLPEGAAYNRLYLLAASTEGDAEGVFSAGNARQAVTVPYYSGFIGQWGHTGHTDGFLKDAEIAYVGTHRHASDGDQAYEYTYMFKYGIDIPKGATYVILPDNERIVLFAATLVNENQLAVTPACQLFRTALKKEAGKEAAAPRENLLKGAKVIGCSGFVNKREAPECLFDGNADTKWCDVNSAPNYVDFDLGEAKTLSGWKLVNAGNESHSYVTRTCYLQGRNSTSEDWKTLGGMDGNRNNVVSSPLPASTAVRYLRLLVTSPTQEAGGVVRIYEMEVY